MSFNFVNNHNGSRSIGDKLKELFEYASNEVIIIAPYIGNSALAEKVLELQIPNIRVITKISLNDFLSGASDLQLLIKLLKKNNVEIRYLSNLHAKIYIADKIKAIITSANFTQNGLYNNMEYGVLFEESTDNLIEDVERLWEQAGIFSNEIADELLNQLNTDFIDTYTSIKNKANSINNSIIPRKVSHTHGYQKNLQIFHIKTDLRDVDSKGKVLEDGFVVLKGSTASKSLTDSFPDTYKVLRGKLISEGIIIEKENSLIFTQDYKFNSPSAAAIVVMGRSATGLGEWKLENGKTLREVLKNDKG